MAARLRKTPRFYVYAFDDAEGCAYVGKGSGGRFKHQSRAFDYAQGRIVDWFMTERAALEGEKRYIELLSPRLNKTKGGNGGRVRRTANRLDFWERRFFRVGSQRYVAKLLLACENAKPGTVGPSKVDAIRQVANGCRA